MKVQDLKKYKTLDITEISGSPWRDADKVLGLDEEDQVIMALPYEAVSPEFVRNEIEEAMEAETARTESTYLKEHQSLDDYATKEYVDDAISEIDLSDYYTKAEVDEAIENVDVSDQLVNYAKTTAVTQDIQTAIASETARTEDVYAKKSEIPDLDNYYTKSETDEAIEEAISGISLEGYWTSAQTKTYVDAEITGATASETARTESIYAKKSEIPSLDGYATEDWVESQGYLTEHQSLDGYAKTTAVTQDIQSAIASETARTESTYLKEHQSLDNYYTKAQVDAEITGATEGMATETWVQNQGYLTEHQDLSDYAKTTAVTQAVQTAIAAETARTESTYLKEHQDISGKLDVSVFTGYTGATDTAISGKVDKTDFNTYTGATETALAGKVSESTYSAYTGSTATAIAAKQDTLVSGTNIKTINNESILGSGNIEIQGSGGDVVELTKAQYDALDPPAADTTYIITDAETVDLNDYAMASGLTALETATTASLATKADKVSITARSAPHLPSWNTQGIITGSSTYYQGAFNMNGTALGDVIKSGNNIGATWYAPTSAGTAGQPLLSNGSGAPVWGGYKFAFITQTQYDALSTKDATTIYFITGD